MSGVSVPFLPLVFSLHKQPPDLVDDPVMDGACDLLIPDDLILQGGDRRLVNYAGGKSSFSWKRPGSLG